MIKKLRIKFIVISISSTTLVLFIILGVINLLNYREVVNRTDVVLELLLDNQGRLPKDSYKIARKKNMPLPRNYPLNQDISQFLFQITEK